MRNLTGAGMSQKLMYVFLAASYIVLCGAWLPLSVGVAIILPPAILVASLVLARYQQRLAFDLAFTLNVLLSAFGLWKGAHFMMTFTSVIFALAAWDLQNFLGRLKFAAEEDQPARLEMRHFLQLGVILGLGVAATLISFSIHMKFNFEWALVLALVATIGLGTVVRWLRNREP